MIGHHLKDSLHWLHLFFFKLRTFEREAENLSRWQSVAIFLKVYPLLWLGGLALLCFLGLTSELAGRDFHWQRASTVFALCGLVAGPVGVLAGGLGAGLGAGLVGLLGGVLVSGLLVGLRVGMVVGLDGGLLGGLLGGLVSGLVAGMVAGMVVGLYGGLRVGLFIGLLGELGGGLFIGLLGGLDEVTRFAMDYFLVFSTTFALVFGRPFYWPFHLVQFWRAKLDGSWLARFRHSPVHWDETIGAPLPWLSRWLFQIAKDDREEGLDEVLWVAANRPFQRKAAQKALLQLAVHDLTQFQTVADLSRVATTLDFLLEKLVLEKFVLTESNRLGKFVLAESNRVLVTKYIEPVPSGFSQARSYVNEIAELAADYLKRQTPAGQHKALLALQSSVKRFAKAMAPAPAPTGPELQRVAAQWLQFINATEAELKARLPFENPFIAGMPLREDEHEQFKGRRDLIIKLEEAIFSQRPALLLYGRRRTGKTSTLLNLPRLMSSQFVPVFIDCQNARWADSDALFCYHLTRALYDELAKRKLAAGLTAPPKSEFAEASFTRLDEFLDEVEAHSRRTEKQILLTFDEYERLEEGIRDGKLTRAVLNQMRAIVQHRPRLIVLFSGSHRFEELQIVNWSDYLINVQMLHLSFLAREEARELIEHPTLEFALTYEDGVVDRILGLTHGQPYLVQALGSELVKRRQHRQQATHADLDFAIEAVLNLADAYFENNWRDCNEQEQAVLQSLATGERDGLSVTERQAALQGLSRKELVEQRDEQWHYAVEMFRHWVLKNRSVATRVTDKPVQALQVA